MKTECAKGHPLTTTLTGKVVCRTCDSNRMIANYYRRKSERKVVVSVGNSKIGRVFNVSLYPGRDCRPDAPCRKDCYAKKALLRKDVREAWDTNSIAFRTDMQGALADVKRQLALKKNPKFFRWFVAGDYLNQEHVDGAFDIARSFPNTKFLCFTKRYDLSFEDKPDNFVQVISTWEGFPDTHADTSLPRANVVESRELAEGFICTGSCVPRNFKCWSLNRGESVNFVKH